MELRDKGFKGVEWIILAQYSNRYGAFMKTVIKLRVP
jgi:hypothetical protein